VVVIGDGVRPSSTGRGYVLRRLIRRALTEVWQVDPAGTLGDLPDRLITGTLRHFGQDGPGEGPGEERVRAVLLSEQQRFGDLLSRGREVLRRRRGTGPLTEAEFRYLHETHGLPREFAAAMLQQPAGPQE
jgi:alanyl-tRNA synthetase